MMKTLALLTAFGSQPQGQRQNRPGQKRAFLFLFCLVSTLLLIPGSIDYAQEKEQEQSAAKRAQQVEASTNQNENCACAASVKKLEAIKEAVRSKNSSYRKIYRTNKEFIISARTIHEALECQCAKKPTYAPPPSPPAQPEPKVALLAPADVKSNCKPVIDLLYEFLEPLTLEDAAPLFRNLAVQTNGNAIVIQNFDRRRGLVQSRILRCVDIDEKTFADSDFKKFSAYVFDPKTGLSWQYCSQGQVHTESACEGTPLKSNLAEAKAYCAALPPIANKKWRLPEVHELASLVQKNHYKSARINLSVFSNTPAEVYWANTPYWSDKAIYGLDYESGEKIAYGRNEKAYTRCVVDIIPGEG